MGDRAHRTQARLLAARLASFEGAFQAVAAARELAQLEPERGAWILAALVDLRRRGEARARLALGAIGRAILEAPAEQLSELHRRRLCEAATELELPEVSALFAAPPPAMAPDPDARPRQDPQVAHLTLGHKKMLARSANPDLIARLAAEGDPSVVHNLLVNPRLTESMVVRICARRPIRPEVLRAVFDSPRWSVREQVREAIAKNPYGEPELVLKILPTLHGGALKEIAQDPVLQPDVRAAAERLRRRGEAGEDEA